MDHDDPYFEELFSTLEGLIEAQIVRQEPIRTWDEADGLAASLAFSRCTSLDEVL